MLLDAGLPLLEAIETLGEKERAPAVRQCMEQRGRRAARGPAVVAARSRSSGELFPPLYVATVRAAERTSDLRRRWRATSPTQAQLEAIRKRVVNASIYPAAAARRSAALVGLFLLLYVVPRFGQIYEERGGDLPLLLARCCSPGASWSSSTACSSCSALFDAGRACAFIAAAARHAAPDRQRALAPARRRRAHEALPARALLPHHRHAAARRHAAGRGARAWAPSCCTRCCASGLAAATRAIREGRAVSRVDGGRRPHHAGRAAHARGGRARRQHGRDDGAASPPSTTRSWRAGSTGSRACSSRC